MMFIEETVVPSEDLPLTALREHLRLGSGFGDESLQDSVLESFLRASLSAIEGRSGRILYERGFLWSLAEWQSNEVQRLPVSPIRSLNRITLIGQDGAETEMEISDFRVRPTTFYADLLARDGNLPSIPLRGSVDVRFNAGWGPSWGDIPPDLAQAVLLLAAHYYEYRSEMTLSEGCMPFGVASLIERYKPRRLSFGSAI